MPSIHELHPYQGKFLPAIPEKILKENFVAGQTILDPFVGSGTTLVVARQKGIHAVGVDNSAFACLLTKVKLEKYNLESLKKAFCHCEELYTIKVQDMLCTAWYRATRQSRWNHSFCNQYHSRWFLPQVQQEINFLRDQIESIRNQKNRHLLQIILSRAMHAALCVAHDAKRGELRHPIKKPYYCQKHHKTCHPPSSLLPFFQRYLRDTVTTLQNNNSTNTSPFWRVIHADSRNVALPRKFHGIITSPPYLGQIDYQKDHKYAFETFSLPQTSENEIGSRAKGRRENAKRRYIVDMTQVLNNCQKYLFPDFKIFLVFNDHYQVLDEILSRSNLKITAITSRRVKNLIPNGKNGGYKEKIYVIRKK